MTCLTMTRRSVADTAADEAAPSPAVIEISEKTNSDAAIAAVSPLGNSLSAAIKNRFNRGSKRDKSPCAVGLPKSTINSIHEQSFNPTARPIGGC